MIAEDWPKYATRPGRNETSLDELSFEAWIKQYKPAESFINRAVSYYEKGLWTAMALDITLRLATGGRRGVPEMFRWLWNRYRRRPRAITEADVRDAAAAIGGRRFDGFFASYVHGKRELPLPALWRRAGLAVTARAAWDESDRPAADRDGVRARRTRAWTGIALWPERTLIRNVVPGSPAWRAGLTFGDEIVAVAGRAGDRGDVRQARRRPRPGRARPHRVLPPRRAAGGGRDAGHEPRPQAGRRCRCGRERRGARGARQVARERVSESGAAMTRGPLSPPSPRCAGRGRTVASGSRAVARASRSRSRRVRRRRARPMRRPTRWRRRAWRGCARTSAARGRG